MVTKMIKHIQSTIHTKVPKILSKGKQLVNNTQPTSGRPTKRNGKKKEPHLPLNMEQFKPNS